MYSPWTFYPCSLKPAHEYSLFKITLNFTNQNLCWSHITSLHKIRWLTKFKEFWGAVWPLKNKNLLSYTTNLKYCTCTLAIHKLYYVTLYQKIWSNFATFISLCDTRSFAMKLSSKFHFWVHHNRDATFPISIGKLTFLIFTPKMFRVFFVQNLKCINRIKNVRYFPELCFQIRCF